MPFLLGLLALAGAAYFWLSRARSAVTMAQDMADMAGDVLNAARRFGFRRRADLHAVECLDDAKVAAAAVGIAFLELAGLPSTEQQDALIRSLQQHLGQSHEQAQEAVILGRWLITECGNAQSGLDRLARRLFKLQGHAAFEPVMLVLRDVAAGNRGGMSQRQHEALESLAVIFRLR